MTTTTAQDNKSQVVATIIAAASQVVCALSAGRGGGTGSTVPLVDEGGIVIGHDGNGNPARVPLATIPIVLLRILADALTSAVAWRAARHGLRVGDRCFLERAGIGSGTIYLLTGPVATSSETWAQTCAHLSPTATRWESKTSRGYVTLGQEAEGVWGALVTPQRARVFARAAAPTAEAAPTPAQVANSQPEAPQAPTTVVRKKTVLRQAT